MFTESQQKILRSSGLPADEDQATIFAAVSDDPKKASSLNDAELVGLLEIANCLYRAGDQIISDDTYDFIFLAELQNRLPNHPFLKSVEPESYFSGKKRALPERMLSTEKAYSQDDVKRWAARVTRFANRIGLDSDKLSIRVTPKLDGFAAYDDGRTLYTRGDGRRGTDITRVFQRGLKVGGDGKRGQGPGEIVVSRDYFVEKLSTLFDNSRNFQGAVLAEKRVAPEVQSAIDSGAVLFFPFSQLPEWNGLLSEFLGNFEPIVSLVKTKMPYDIDGVVIESSDREVRQQMGATQHHHRWQIAFKENVETAEVKVIEVIPNTSRSGRVSPIARLEPTRLSGATLSRVSAHHYKMVESLGIGPGAVIRLVRSGLVIPKIDTVLKPAQPQLPQCCPSCHSDLVWEGDHLYCSNTAACPAQIENAIEYFFRSLQNVDGFGAKTISKLHANGISSIIEIYSLSQQRFEEIGFGPKQSENLVSELRRSREEQVEDWRFLGAFGLFRMGFGNCERLLQHHHLEALFELTADELAEIEGFAAKTAERVVAELIRIRPLFEAVNQLGFNLKRTPLKSEAQDRAGPLSGKQVVFTGSMIHGSRAEMETEAKKMGATIGRSVTGKTDLLVTGEKVGENKIKKAVERGVTRLSEEEYLQLINSESF